MCGWDERMDATNVSTSVSLHLESRLRKAIISSSAPSAFNKFFFSQARECTTFPLHDLTDFYVERVTAHHIKINYHACFYNLWQNSKTKLKLKPRGAYAACVFCV